MSKYMNYNYYDRQVDFLKSRSEQGYQCDLVLFGDSITEGFDLNKYGVFDVSYLNSGVGGDVVELMYERIERDVLSYLPSKVIYMGGINNVRPWFRTISDNQVIDDVQYFEIKEHILKYSKLIIETLLNNEIEVFVGLITKVNSTEFNSRYLNYIIDVINQEIINICDELNVVYIDYNQVLVHKNGLLDLNLCSDGLHPNEFGYLEMYKLISKYI